MLQGGYGTLKISLSRDAEPLHYPASALLFNKSGMRVATVGPVDKILFKTVTIARDLGRDIELASGITADDRIVIAPPDGLSDGDKVRITGGNAPNAGKPKAESEKKEVKG